jgi:post-segregation antitoxin (ccd killing protein)
MMRRLAEQAVQAAIQAEEEAAWQAHTTRTRPAQGAQVP